MLRRPAVAVSSVPIRAFRRGLAGLLVALAGTGTACSPDTAVESGLNPSSPGTLIVRLEGLPAGTTASIAVASAQGYQRSVTAADTLTNLTAGSYTVTALDVSVGGDRYAAAPVTQSITVTAGAATTVQVAYVLVTARLQVALEGVPGGGNASLELSGPGGYTHSLSGPELLTGLAPGAYQLRASELSLNGDRYQAAPDLLDIVIPAPSLTPVLATVRYSLASGRLVVTVSGVPPAAVAAVRVTGPGCDSLLSASATLVGLTPGSYSVSASDVQAGGTSYSAPGASVSVAASAIAATVSVSYAPASGALQVVATGVPAGASATITVSGPNGFARTLNSSQTLRGLSPGVYGISAAGFVSGNFSYAAAPASQQSTVAAGTTAVAAISFAVTTGALDLAVAGLPSGVGASVSVSGPAGYVRSVTASQLLLGLAPGSYTVSAAPVAGAGQSYAPNPPTQSASVAAGATAAVSVGYAASGAGSSLDLRIDGAYLTQATQRYDGSVPLVAGRDAVLRVFALANQANTAQAQVRVRLYSGGSLLQSYTLPAAGGAVPANLDQSSLANSWNLLVPGALVQPGLRLLADVDPANGIAESDEGNNQFPQSGTPLSLDVRALPTFAVRFVPILQQANGLQGNVSSANQEGFLTDLKKLLPVGAYDADLRSPYTTTAPALLSNDGNSAWNTVLSELLALRTAEASGRYYYGVVKVSYTSGIAGLGYVGGSSKSAIGWDYLPSGAYVMAHEVGHNLGRMHAPCGSPTLIDPSYPYNGGQIGAWGMDVASLQLKAPTVTDVMSYCAPNWISDYNWSAMLSYRQSGPNNAPAAGSGSGLLIWGRITPGGVVLEPAFEVAATSAAPEPGPYRLELLDASGATLQTVPFDAAPVADLPGSPGANFAFVVPLGSQQRALAGLRVLAGSRSALRAALAPGGADPAPSLSRPGAGQLELRWDGARFPMALVRDAATGEILSFARGGAARLWARGSAFQLQFSDGVRSVSLPTRVLR